MYAVGRLISRSIYTVSGPFHPFGGAVDIVVVEQKDGSFKSSPWYVRFGKFQGVLKTREKIVSICVNGVDADFHMYLDHTGEAYFLEEVEEEVEEEAVLEASTFGELTDEQLSNRKPMKSLSCNFDAEGSPLASPDSVVNGSGVTRSGSKRARLLGLVFGRRLSQGESHSEISRTTSLDRAEIAADLLDVNWATSLAIDKPKPQKASNLSEAQVFSDVFNKDEDAACQTNVMSTSADEFSAQELSEGIINLSQDLDELHIGNVGYNEHKEDMVQLLPNSDSPICESKEIISEINYLQEIDTLVAAESFEARPSRGTNGEIAEAVSLESNKIYGEPSSNNFLPPIDNSLDNKGVPSRYQAHNLRVKSHSHHNDTVTDERHEEEQFAFSDDELKPTEDQDIGSSSSSNANQEMDSLIEESEAHHEAIGKSILASPTSFKSLEKGYQEDVEKKFQELLEKQQQKMTFPIDINGFHDAASEIDERMVESLPNMWSQIDSLEADHQPCRSFDASTTSPRWLTVRSTVSSHRQLDEDREVEMDAVQPAGTAEVPSETPKSDSFSSGVGRAIWDLAKFLMS